MRSGLFAVIALPSARRCMFDRKTLFDCFSRPAPVVLPCPNIGFPRDRLTSILKRCSIAPDPPPQNCSCRSCADCCYHSPPGQLNARTPQRFVSGRTEMTRLMVLPPILLQLWSAHGKRCASERGLSSRLQRSVSSSSWSRECISGPPRSFFQARTPAPNPCRSYGELAPPAHL